MSRNYQAEVSKWGRDSQMETILKETGSSAPVLWPHPLILAPGVSASRAMKLRQPETSPRPLWGLCPAVTSVIAKPWALYPVPPGLLSSMACVPPAAGAGGLPLRPDNRCCLSGSDPWLAPSSCALDPSVSTAPNLGSAPGTPLHSSHAGSPMDG